MAEQKSREAWVEYVKGFAILLVVYRHVFNGYGEEGAALPEWVNLIQLSVYNIRMPLFFIVAGVFVRRSLKKRGARSFITYKTSTILYPYVIWLTVQTLLQVIFSGSSHAQREFADLRYLLVDPYFFKSQFWFLYVLFFTSLLFTFQLPVRYNFLAAVVLNILSGFMPDGVIESICYFYFFVALGDLLASERVIDWAKQRASKLLWGMVPLTLAGQTYWLRHLNLADEQLLLHTLIATVGCLTVIVLFFVVSRTNALAPIKFVGSYSMYIYILHVIVQAAFREVLLLSYPNVDPLVAFSATFVVGVFLPIVLYWFVDACRLHFLFNGNWLLARPQKQKSLV